MADPTRKEHTEFVNIPMSPTYKAMLKQLKTDTRRSMAQVVRDGIESEYRMAYANEPRCANSAHCKCPALHMVQQTNPKSNEAIMTENAKRTDPDGYMEEHQRIESAHDVG